MRTEYMYRFFFLYKNNGKNHSIYGNEYLDHKRFYVAKHVKDPYLDVHHKQIDVRIRQSNFCVFKEIKMHFLMKT